MAAYTGSGLGTRKSPYLITTYSELCEMQTCDNALSSHWKLMAGIDASASADSEWVPIGPQATPFTGSFNGNSCSISNLYINTGYPQVGFFGNIDSEYGCYKLILDEPNVTGTAWGYFDWSEEKYINGDVGSLIGALDNGCIERCAVINPTINISPNGEYMVLGGFAGENHGTIKECCAIDISCAVGTHPNTQVGGFVGFCYVGLIKNCYCTGNISGTIYDVSGGFVGVTGSKLKHHGDFADSIFYNCYAAVTMTNGDNGFCGVQSGGTVTFTSCYYDATLSGKSDTGKGEPKTTTQMYQPSTFVGWNFFGNPWYIETGVSYPDLVAYGIRVIVTSSVAYKNNTMPFGLTALFSYSVQVLEESEIWVENGTVSNFVRDCVPPSLLASRYTFDIIPTGTGDIVVEIPAGVARGGYYGTLNLVSNTVTIPYDDVEPTVSSFSPLDNATDVEVTDNLIINFNENIYAGTGDIVIKKTSDDSVIETIPVGNPKVTISGSQVTINPANLSATPITECYVQISGGCFRDFCHNYYVGITDKTSWSFTTIEYVVPIPNPSVWLVYPAYAGGKFTMTATTATDDNPPVYYSFEWIGGGGGTSSGWITNPHYECSAAGHGMWKFRTKDSLGNIGSYSRTYHTLYGLIP